MIGGLRRHIGEVAVVGCGLGAGVAFGGGRGAFRSVSWRFGGYFVRNNAIGSCCHTVDDINPALALRILNNGNYAMSRIMGVMQDL